MTREIRLRMFTDRKLEEPKVLYVTRSVVEVRYIPVVEVGSFLVEEVRFIPVVEVSKWQLTQWEKWDLSQF